MNDDSSSPSGHAQSKDKKIDTRLDSRPESAQGRLDKRSLVRRLVEYFLPGANSKEELIEVLATAEDNDVIRSDSRAMLEGVLKIADMTARDVLVAAPRMDIIDIADEFKDILNVVIETGHSRFPVFEGERENIIGILMAKDLLKRQRAPEINLRTLLRPAVFVPESKRLNDLLRDFRSSRSHLAVVLDEFDRVAGLVTLEDVVEEIVGEIEDEFDIIEDSGDIFGLSDQTYRVSGDAAPELVSETFKVALQATDDEEFDTIGGLVSHEMGYVPKRGETFKMAGLTFTVLHTRSGVVKWFKVAADEAADDAKQA